MTDLTLDSKTDLEDEVETNVSDDTDAPGQAIRANILRAVNFDVEAIVGGASLTLDALEAMTSGSLVPLSTGLNGKVSLRLNGVEIARGELVSFGDNFAVKITDVAE